MHNCATVQIWTTTGDLRTAREDGRLDFIYQRNLSRWSENSLISSLLGERHGICFNIYQRNDFKEKLSALRVHSKALFFL